MNIQNKYESREEEIRATLTLEKCICRIKEEYHSEYTADIPGMDAWDQLLALEAVEGSSPIKDDKQGQPNDNTSVNGNVNDGSKRKVYFDLTETKQKVITELKQFNYRTPPVILAKLLSEFFQEWPSDPGYWLYISQKYNPRAIWRTLDQLIKVHRIINNPPGYFTKLIKFRKPRRSI